MTEYFIEFEPVGRRGPCPAGRSLLECARSLGVDLASICGGMGTCGRCMVQVVTGAVTEPTTGEREVFAPRELEEGYRLACRAVPLSDCRVCVPPESLTSLQRTQVAGLELAVPPDPPVRARRVQLAPLSLADPRADAERLLEALDRETADLRHAIDFEVLRNLSPRLRSENWEVQAWVRDGEVVAVGPRSGRSLGLAVDLGTTKIAGYLLDMESGQTLAAEGVMNPQVAYGEDVIARIGQATRTPAEAVRLQESAVEALNRLAAGLCAQVDAGPEAIVEAVVVGNTAMHHLFLRLPVAQLARAPYVPAVRAALDVKARDLGLHIAPGAYVHLLPNVAGFVGADHVAMLLATGAWQAEGVVLALDIGTNTEICLASHGEMVSVSCASGPAFEGAHVQHGMRAAAGAIEHVRLVRGWLEVQTIGGVPAAGLCGSGLLDAVAQLRLAGVLNRAGQMGDHPRVRVHQGKREFVLVGEEEREGRPAITLTQRDVRELQLAKAAIRTGIQALLDGCGQDEGGIEQVIIAGAFGTYIDVASAVAIGMLPPLPLERFRQVGNAAGTGARLALISRDQRATAQQIAGQVRYVELASTHGFARKFAQAMVLAPAP